MPGQMAQPSGVHETGGTPVTQWDGGYVPVVAMWAVGALANALKAQREPVSGVPSDVVSEDPMQSSLQHNARLAQEFGEQIW